MENRRTDSGLSPQQERFVHEYIMDPTNQTKAAIRAGYALGSAKGSGSRLMADPQVRAAIAARQEERAHKMGITEDRVLQELALIAFSQVQDVASTDEEGNLDVNMQKISRTSTPSEIIVSTTRGKHKSKIVTVKSVKLSDKVSALEKLGKHLGMFKEQIEHTGTLTLEQLVESSMKSENKTEEN